MNSHNTQRRDTISLALFLHLMAVIYFICVHFNVVIKHHIKWDSEMGTLMATPLAMIIGYAWLMILFEYIGRTKYYTDSQHPQVMENEGDWKAKSVHWTAKHSKVWVK